MIDKSLYETEYMIDKDAHPDSQMIKFCGKEIPLGEIRKIYEKFEEKKYNMASFYDDMFQYTSLGLLDVIFDIKNINSPIPFKSFFKRKATYGKQFVYEAVKRFNIEKEEVDEIEKKYYEEIIRRSPISHNAESFFKIREICDKQLLIIKYPLSIERKMIRHIQEAFGKDEYISLDIDYIGNKSEEEYLKELSEAKTIYFDIAICQDAASLIEFIVSRKINNTQILTPLEHNGLSAEAKFTFEAYLEGTGPNNCKLNYIKEEI
jgi:hypothetical protein